MASNLFSWYAHFVNFLASSNGFWAIFISMSVVGLIRFFLLILKYDRRRREYSKLLPGYKYSWYHFLGDFSQMISLKKGQSMHAAMLQMNLNDIKKFQNRKLMCYWASYVPIVMIWRKEAAEVILQDKEKEGRSKIYKLVKPLFGTGLLTSDYSKWKPRRKLLAPCFHADVLKSFMPAFNEQAQILAKYFQKSNGEFIHTGQSITLFVTEVLLQTILGVKLEVQENTGVQYVKSIRRLAKLLVRRLTNIWSWPDFIFYRTKKGKEASYHLEYIEDFTRSVIKEKKAKYLSPRNEENQIKRKALLDYLLELHLKAKDLSEEDIREEVATFSAAGQGTTAAAISWALYLIGTHKDIQEKIHAELDKVFGEDVERHVTTDDFNDLKYLDCVLKESKRLYPPVSMIPKKAGVDLNICGYTVPRGTTCIVLTYCVHRDEEEFPNPEKFDPDRFLPENSAKRHPFAYIPFAAGPRNCIGSKFSRMEEMVAVTTILRYFVVEAKDQGDSVPIVDMTLRPAAPFQMKFTPRRLDTIIPATLLSC